MEIIKLDDFNFLFEKRIGVRLDTKMKIIKEIWKVENSIKKPITKNDDIKEVINVLKSKGYINILTIFVLLIIIL